MDKIISEPRLGVPQFHIQINNNYSEAGYYGIYCADPNNLWQPITSYFIDVANGVQPGSGTAKFTISKQLYAVCGLDSDTRARTAPGDGYHALVMDKKLVTLGYRDDDGYQVPGTSCVIVAPDESSPAFSRKPTLDNGAMGAFSVQTGTDFTVNEANDEHFYQGYGCPGPSGSPTSIVNRCITVVPKPSTLSQIQPKNTFYAVIGHFDRGSVVPTTVKASACKIDFDQLNSDFAYVNHTSSNTLVLQKVT